MDTLSDLLRAGRRILFFTGAGISTGSGIPDFRGPNGIWKRRAPVYFDEFVRSEAKRVEYWQGKLEFYELSRDAKPNATHFAIAELQATGRVTAIVTQNIDGLHQDGGSDPDSVIEVHGTNRWIECLSCHDRIAPDVALARFRDDGRAPRCHCDGLLKPATISFGQSLKPAIMERAFTAAATADLVISLGSTLSVEPAASIPLAGVRNGAPYVVINRGETEHDRLATLRIDGDIAEVLPPAVAAAI